MHNCSAWHQPRLTRNAEMSAARNLALLTTQTFTLSARPCSELFIEISSVLVWILSGLSGPGITRPECICFDWYQTPFVFLSSFSNFHFLTQFHLQSAQQFQFAEFYAIFAENHRTCTLKYQSTTWVFVTSPPSTSLESTSWRTVQQICMTGGIPSSKGWWHFL